MNNNEKVCDIKVESSILNGCELDASFPKFMIDEYPIISIAAAFAILQVFLEVYQSLG